MSQSAPSCVQDASVRQQKTAMKLSFGVGLAMLVFKMLAFFLTGSAAIFSDAAESVVHIVAVGFAAWSLWYSLRPADSDHMYGHSKIALFSAGFEGAMIIIAAIYIIYISIAKWMAGLKLENLGEGTLIIAGASLANAALGAWLVWTGRRNHSLIIEANGKHILTDSVTSLGVVIGLVLALWTGWLPFDPLIAIAVALNILWTGGRLIMQSFGGLMDKGDPELHEKIRQRLAELTEPAGVEFHNIRFRVADNRLWLEFHLLMPGQMPLRQAHRIATDIETQLKASLPTQTFIISHLEALEDHGRIHHEHHIVNV